MFKVTKYPHGTFSWADCASTDSATGKKFYAELMGWQIEDMPMGDDLFYTMYKQDGEYTAALSPMQAGMQEQHVPSHWNSYITVDNVDALAGKVKELGGTIIAEPFDVFDSGRMMVIQDPTGAMVSFWQAQNHIGAGLVNTPGALTWNELYTRDLEKAKDFYSKLLGWTYTRQEGAMDYFVIMNGSRPNGGMMTIAPTMGDMPPNWTVYFSVADIDKTVEKAKSLGGQLATPIMDAGGVGRIGFIIDPTGAMAAYIQTAQPQEWDLN
jgi:hypothetical protein